MKCLLLLFVFAYSSSVWSQQNQYNTKKGYLAEGYDVVAYYNNDAVEGDEQFSKEYEGVKFKFSSIENLNKFVANPDKYIPQYGGYCAYAIADKGKKVDIDPKTFLVCDGKLYLFYNSWGTNTLELWNKKETELLKQKADKNWKAILKNE